MVARTIILDSGPLGLITNPNPAPQNIACADWLKTLLSAGTRVVIPEIVDYEIRRELLRANKQRGLQSLDTICRTCPICLECRRLSQRGLQSLDTICRTLDFCSLNSQSMRLAAQLWADARQQGQPTANDDTIDIDVILAAQALCLGVDFVIATTNVKHLQQFAASELWTTIDA